MSDLKVRPPGCHTDSKAPTLREGAKEQHAQPKGCATKAKRRWQPSDQVGIFDLDNGLGEPRYESPGCPDLKRRGKRHAQKNRACRETKTDFAARRGTGKWRVVSAKEGGRDPDEVPEKLRAGERAKSGSLTLAPRSV